MLMPVTQGAFIGTPKPLTRSTNQLLVGGQHQLRADQRNSLPLLMQGVLTRPLGGENPPRKLAQPTARDNDQGLLFLLPPPLVGEDDDAQPPLCSFAKPLRKIAEKNARKCKKARKRLHRPLPAFLCSDKAENG